MKQLATDATIRRFIEALYPDAPELAMAAFDEETVLRFAADERQRRLARIEEAQARIERLIDACEAVAHSGANHPDFTERCSFCEQPWDRHEDDCEVALSLSLARAWLAKVREGVAT